MNGQNDKSKKSKNKQVKINPERWNADRVPDAEDKFIVIFQKIDVSGDGILEPEELINFVSTIFRTRVVSERPQWNDSDILACCRTMCFERGKLSVHGFKLLCLPFVSRADRLDLCDMLIAIREFGRTDVDGNGFLVAEEVLETLGRILKNTELHKSAMAKKILKSMSDRKDSQMNLPVFLRGFTSFSREYFINGGLEGHF